MAIKALEVASIKTTQEPVYVLSVVGDLVEVRRPVMGSDGVRHLVETFTLGELETESDRIERTYKERQALQGRVFGEDETGKDMVRTIGSAN